tara:strand:- start:18 stop:224 length:207 start_codon:yes stop_codon:yes gene_type:complete
MEFKVTIILSHISGQTEEDMMLNAHHYIQDDLKMYAKDHHHLNIESVEDITDYAEMERLHNNLPELNK